MFPAAPAQAIVSAHLQSQQERPQKMANFGPQGFTPGPSPISEDMIHFQRKQLQPYQFIQQHFAAHPGERQGVSPTQYQTPTTANLQYAGSKSAAGTDRTRDALQHVIGQPSQLPPHHHLQHSMGQLAAVQMSGQVQQAHIQQAQPHTQRPYKRPNAPSQNITNARVPSSNSRPAAITAAQFRENMMARKAEQEREMLRQSTNGNTTQPTTSSSQVVQQNATHRYPSNQNQDQLQVMQNASIRGPGHLKRIKELEAELQAMTQERDSAIARKGNSHHLVSANFSPAPGLSYKFGKNDKENDRWTCLHSLGHNGPRCNRINSSWMKMRIAGGRSSIWSERTRCGVCQTMKQAPQQINEGSGPALLPSPPYSSNTSPAGWDHLGGFPRNVTPTPAPVGAAQYRREFLRQQAALSKTTQPGGGENLGTTKSLSFPFPGQLHSGGQSPKGQSPGFQQSCFLSNVPTAQNLPSDQSRGISQYLQSVAVSGQAGQATLTQDNGNRPNLPEGNMLFVPSPMLQGISAPVECSRIQSLKCHSGGSADAPLLIEDDEILSPPTIEAGGVAGILESVASWSNTPQSDTPIIPVPVESHSIIPQTKAPVLTGALAEILPQMPDIRASVDTRMLQVSSIDSIGASSPNFQQSGSGTEESSTPPSSAEKNTLSNGQLLNRQLKASITQSTQSKKRPSPEEEEEITISKRQKTLSPKVSSSEKPQFEKALGMQSTRSKPKKNLENLRVEAAKGHFKKIIASSHRAWMDIPPKESQVQQWPSLQGASKKKKPKGSQTEPRKPNSAGKNYTMSSPSSSIGEEPSNISTTMEGMATGHDTRAIGQEGALEATALLHLANQEYTNDVEGFEIDYSVKIGGGFNAANDGFFDDSGLVVDMSSQATLESEDDSVLIVDMSSQATRESDALHSATALSHALKKMKLPELKKELKHLNLKCNGNKEDLIERLIGNGFNVENSVAALEKSQKNQEVEEDKDFDFDIDTVLMEGIEQHLATEASQEEQAAVENEDFDIDLYLMEGIEQHLADEAAPNEQVADIEQQSAVETPEEEPVADIDLEKDSAEVSDGDLEIAGLQASQCSKMYEDYEDKEHSDGQDLGDTFGGFRYDSPPVDTCFDSEESEEE